jgi:thymidine kinase
MSALPHLAPDGRPHGLLELICKAVCHSCGEPAIFTQRLVDGRPAPFSGKTVVIGGLDSYEARCRAYCKPG